MTVVIVAASTAVPAEPSVHDAAAIVAADAGDNQVLVQRRRTQSALLEVRIDGRIEFAAPIAGLRSLRLDGGAGDDTFVVDYANGFFDVPTRINGGTQSTSAGDALVTRGDFPGEASVTYTTGAAAHDGMSGQVELSDGVDAHAITFTGLEPIEDLTASATLTINASAGADTINFVAGPTSSGNDPITMAPALTYQVNFAGAAEAINFRNKTAVTINALAGIDTITIDQPTKFGDALATLTINAGTEDDDVIARRTPSGVTTTVFADVGDDSLDVGNVANSLDQILGDIIFQAQGGLADALLFRDQGDAGPNTYTMTNNTLTRDGGVSVSFVATEQVTLNATAANDTINATSSFATVAASLNALSGDDTFNVGSGGMLDQHTGSLTLIGNAGANDVINWNDQSDTGGNSYLFTTFNAGRTSNPHAISGIETMTLNASLGADSIVVESTAAGTQLTLNGGNGDDVVEIGSASNSLDTVLGDIVFLGQTGTVDRIHFDDSGDTTANNYTLSNNNINRSGTLASSFATVEQVEVDAGLLGDTINLTSNFSTVAASIDGGGGNDTFNVGNAGLLDLVLGTVVLDGAAGATDALNINDQSRAVGSQYHVSPTRFDRNGTTAMIGFTGFESWALNAGTMADTIDVDGLANPMSASVSGGNPVIAPGDHLRVFGPAPTAVVPTGVGSGDITLSPTQLLQYLQIEQLTIDRMFANGFE